MKAITIWQPWASLIAIGEKVYETRGWPTQYRGPIAIHAAMRAGRIQIPAGLDCSEALKAIQQAEEELGSWEGLPRGAIVAIGELVNCWHIVWHPGTNVDKAKHIPVGAESMVTDKHAPGFGDFIVPDMKELVLGNWNPQDGRNGMRFAWEIRNVEPLERPVPVRGRQGLWNWDEVIPEEDDLPFPEVLL